MVPRDQSLARADIGRAASAAPGRTDGSSWLRRILKRFRIGFYAPVFGSARYWERRYRLGRQSGAGSVGRLAAFKAEVINRFVAANNIRSVVEFGCGDGQQLALASYPSYLGLDVSRRAVELCRERFKDDPSKRFALPRDVDAAGRRATLALSLDVVYHLIEDRVFAAYMHELFDAAGAYVIIYSSDRDIPSQARHVRHRAFTGWVALHLPDWELFERVQNAYPYDPAHPGETSVCDFFFFRRTRR